MKKLEGFQRKYLRGIAHDLKPLVIIGHRGLTAEVQQSIDQTLNDHELIKVKFNDFKEKEHKKEICDHVEKTTDSVMVGLIGHTAIFYRHQKDPEKRKISLPKRKRTL